MSREYCCACVGEKAGSVIPGAAPFHTLTVARIEGRYIQPPVTVRFPLTGVWSHPSALDDQVYGSVGLYLPTLTSVKTCEPHTEMSPPSIGNGTRTS